MAFKRNFLWMLASKVVQISAGLLMGALINRSLGPEGRGIFAELLTWMGLFVMVFGVSLDTAIYHLANREVYGNDDASRFTTILWLNLGYSLAGVAALTLLVHLRPQLFSATTASHAMLLALLIATNMLALNLLVFYQAVGRIRAAAVIGAAQYLVQLPLILAAYARGFLTLSFILWSLAIMQTAALVLLLALAVKGGLLSGSFSGEMAKVIWWSGLKQHAATVSTFVYMKINQIILFKYCGEADTGFFSVALAITMAMMFIPQTFQTVLYPRVIHAADDYEVTIRALRVGFYGWGLAIVAGMLLVKPLLLLYAGSSFLPATNILRILMIAAWFLPLSSLIAPYCVKVGAFKALSLSALCLGILSIGLNFLLIPKYSAMGAAIATSLTCVFGFFLGIAFLWILTGKNACLFIILKKKDIFYGI